LEIKCSVPWTLNCSFSRNGNVCCALFEINDIDKFAFFYSSYRQKHKLQCLGTVAAALAAAGQKKLKRQLKNGTRQVLWSFVEEKYERSTSVFKNDL